MPVSVCCISTMCERCEKKPVSLLFIGYIIVPATIALFSSHLKYFFLFFFLCKEIGLAFGNLS